MNEREPVPSLFVMEMIKNYLRLLTIMYGQPMNLENILEKNR